MPPAGLQDSSCERRSKDSRSLTAARPVSATISGKKTFAVRPLFEGARLKQGLDHPVGRALAEAELPRQIAQCDFRLRLGDTLQQLEGFLAGIWLLNLFRVEFSFVQFDERLVFMEYSRKCQANLKLKCF